MELAFNTARWVVGKALAPVGDTALEAWAASNGLGKNVDDLKTELLCVQAVLKPTLQKDTDNNEALEKLLQKLQDLAYNAEDVLDEVDYFRIQDKLDRTAEAADVHPKGCARHLLLNARHTAKAAAKQLGLHRTDNNQADGGEVSRGCISSTLHSVELHKFKRNIKFEGTYSFQIGTLRDSVALMGLLLMGRNVFI